MKINGCGQAKILTPEEKMRLLNVGCLNQRDRTMNECCYYCACRSAEMRQLHYKDVFNSDGSVKEFIVLRKPITKNKQATRSLKTHPNLKLSLKKYVEAERELYEIWKIVGHWDHQSLVRGDNISADGQVFCPKCSSFDLAPAGNSRGKKLFKCKDCCYRFQAKTAFLERPELKEAVIRLGVQNSYSYGFLFANPKNPYLFPGSEGNGCIGRTTFKEIFAEACDRADIVGAGTHSWRRTALTEMEQANVPLRVIQKISGHQRLKNLQRYLEVSEADVRKAILKLPTF